MKKISILLTLVLASLVFIAADITPQQRYIDRYSSTAVEEMYRSGVPASITLAQGMLESNCGQSPLAVKGNNHFGIKCHSDWTGKTMSVDDDRRGECFRVYSNPAESFSDHSDFLRYRSRYHFLFENEITDYKAWAYGLKEAGYATDPQYPAKLIRIIEENDLTRFDRIQPESEKQTPIPDAPTVLEEVVEYAPAERESFKFSLTRQVYATNGIPFVYSVEGDTYRGLAESNGLFLREILRFNDLKEECEIFPGTVIYLKAKKSKAARGIDKYIVDSDGESLRGICQHFAVKVKSIEKLNGFTSDHILREGDTVYLR